MYQEIMRNCCLSVDAKAIYAYLSSIAGFGNKCYPSMDTITHEMGITHARARKYINELVSNGIVEKERCQSGNIKGGNIYKLTHEVETETVKDLHNIAEKVEIQSTTDASTTNASTTDASTTDASTTDASTTDASTTDASSVRRIDHQTTNNNNTNNNSITNNRKNNMVNGEYSKAFEEFWKAYPRKIGKGEAYKKYKARLNDGWSKAELLEAAKNYAGRVARERTEQKYIKHAKTFLSENTPFTDFLPKGKEAGQILSEDCDNPYAEWGQ